MNLSAFILAAGLGERLRPITNFIPKPLLPILGKPVLESVLERVSALPIYKICINLHHKREFIENWIKQSSFSKDIELFPEDPMLGTGGALKNAEGFLKNSSFLVHNSDIISDIDLKQLIALHLSSNNLATLVVHNYPEFNKLEIDKNGFFNGIAKINKIPFARYMAFTGIAVYQPEFLKFLPAGISSVTDAWLKAVDAGYKIGTFDVSGCYWSDVGTPASYAKAVIDELRRNGETVYVHPSVNNCKYVEMNGYIALENKSSLSKGVSLRNCIVLQESHVNNGLHHENCIISPGFKIDLSESDLFDSTDSNAFFIGTGGSDRKYYRTRKDSESVVLMQCQEGDPDFRRQIEYTRFFKKYSVPVPELLEANPDMKSASFEDLGDLSLYSWLKCPRDLTQIEEIYRRVIDISVLIHTVAAERVSECPLLQKRVFDYAHLRWESNYFIERFLGGIKNIRIKNPSAMDDEFHRLAVEVDSFHKTVIHRDFQSQNIMITKGKIPRILDYQGARIGPPAYDVASILWDPYCRLDDNLRDRLLNYYIKNMIKGLRGITEKEFKASLFPCRLQRHMQALGAYGFLSAVKGKKYFMKFVPEGVRLLKEDIVFAKDEYPELYNLITSIS